MLLKEDEDSVGSKLKKFVSADEEQKQVLIEAGGDAITRSALLLSKAFNEEEEESSTAVVTVKDFVDKVSKLMLNLQGIEPTSPIPAQRFGLEAEAAGLYPLQSCVNHSCLPNITYQCNEDHRLTILAKRDIRAGEELCAAYRDMGDASYEDRQLMLKKWNFVCGCPRCKAEEEESIDNKPE
eukprot:TRINITY_DN1995_c0_g1_i3.p1 TRINITY_DN1995_c0_g1~~TRINITY_DN1995_c0_g1_i3.p1  ORF type:complete len:182 (+),score=42.90 TRINITY_DN1995_c0_g1_i3:742-1287(+)